MKMIETILASIITIAIAFVCLMIIIYLIVWDYFRLRRKMSEEQYVTKRS